MKFIVTRYAARKLGFYQGAEFLVGHVLGDEAVTGKDALGVGVDNEDLFVAGIKKDGIGGLRADTVNGEELFAQLGGGGPEHARERTGIFRAKKADEGFQFFCFLAEVAGRANQRGEAAQGNAFQSERSEQTPAAEIGDGALDVGPGGILGEDGADDNFEGRFCRPPILRAEGVKKRLVIQRQRICTRESRRGALGCFLPRKNFSGNDLWGHF